MTNFTREWLLLKHTAGATLLAVEILVQDYGGGDTEYYKDLNRSKTGALLIVRGTYKRHFMGLAILDHEATGTVTYNSVAYTKATPALVQACYTKTDLQVSSFEDYAVGTPNVPIFWNGEIASVYNPRVVFQPTGELRLTPLEILEK